MPTQAELLAPLRHEADTAKLVGRVMDIVIARFDVVAPQESLSLSDDMGRARLAIPEPIITDTGVVEGDLVGGYTRTAFSNMAERLRIPQQFLNRLADEGRPRVRTLGAHIVNELCAVDDRRALYRYLRTDDNGYLLRAIRSDRYALIDNDSALTAIMGGLSAHDLQLNDCEVEGDVTVDRLRLRIAVPAIQIKAPDLMKDYRSPFTGEKSPIIWAGIEIANSETGQGAFSVAPRAVILACKNGATRAIEFRRAHIGVSMDDGEVKWSQATTNAALALITSQVTDAVKTFISTDFLNALADEMRVAKGLPVESPSKAIEVVQQRFGFTDDETQRMLDFFTKSGDVTVLGLSQAVTALAQEAVDGDRQTELELAGAAIVAKPAAFAV